MYNNSIIYGKTDAFDTQMEQYGYSHEDVVEEMSFNSSNTNMETERTLDDITTDYGTDDLKDIDKQIDKKLGQLEKDLGQTAIKDTGMMFSSKEDYNKAISTVVAQLEKDIQSAMDRGVKDLETIIENSLTQMRPNGTPPTETVIHEIQTKITEKHTLERDREIIKDYRNNK